MPDARVFRMFEGAVIPPGVVTHLDDVTSYYQGGAVASFPLLRASGAAGIVDILDVAAAARRLRLWDAIYFGIIHVIPRVKDLGAVISATSYNLEVWNADDVAHLGVSYSLAGSGGVSMTGGVALPAYWPPFGSYVFQVDVAGDGEAVIDAMITFLFPGFLGTDHRLIGFKLTLLASSPDWERQQFEETFGYRTSVKTSQKGDEQRRLLASKPSRELTLTVLAVDPIEAGALVAAVYNGGRFLFGIPYWADATPLDAPLSPGATVIACDTTARIFQVGGLLALWRDARTTQTLTIAAVGAGSITVTSLVVGSWPAGSTLVIPVLPARPAGAAQIDHPAPGVCTVSGAFTTEPL